MGDSFWRPPSSSLLWGRPWSRGAAVLPQNFDSSAIAGNEAEDAIAVNPTNPSNIVTQSTLPGPVSGLSSNVSFNGGRTWTRGVIGGPGDPLGEICCDQQLAWDQYGNLWMVYLLSANAMCRSRSRPTAGERSGRSSSSRPDSATSRRSRSDRTASGSASRTFLERGSRLSARTSRGSGSSGASAPRRAFPHTGTATTGTLLSARTDK